MSSRPRPRSGEVVDFQLPWSRTVIETSAPVALEDDVEEVGAEPVGVLDRVLAGLVAGHRDVVRLDRVGARLRQPAAHRVARRRRARRGRRRPSARRARRASRARAARSSSRRRPARRRIGERAERRARRAPSTSGARRTAAASRSRSRPTSSASRRPLDEPVGVQQQRRAGLQRRACAGRSAASPGRPSAARARPSRKRASPSGADEQRRRVAGVRVAQRARSRARRSASTTVVRTQSPSPSAKRLRRSAIAPLSSACMRIARSALRIWPIVAAAAMPRPTTSPIADRDAPAGQRDRVVPVAADVGAVVAGLVARGERHARHRRQRARQQRALQLLRRSARSRSYRRVRAIARLARPAASAEQVDRLGVELAPRQRADVQAADDLRAGDERHREQRADRRPERARVDARARARRGSPRPRARAATRSTTSSSPRAPCRARRRSRRRRRPARRRCRAVVGQHDRRAVGVERLEQPVEQLAQQAVEILGAERRDGDRLHEPQPLGRGLGLRARATARGSAARGRARRGGARAGPGRGG